jgi:hypothetical protein
MEERYMPRSLVATQARVANFGRGHGFRGGFPALEACDTNALPSFVLDHRRSMFCFAHF